MAKPLRILKVRQILGVSLSICACTLPASGSPAESSAHEFFEKRVRPVLAQHCYECHSRQSEKLKGGLRLDSREALLKGGETGVAIILGEPEKSRLIEAVRHTHPDFKMPPKQRLSDAEIDALAEWIKMGAPWPAESQPELAAEAEKIRRAHWAWQPVRRADPPKVRGASWPKNSIDYFILARLEAAGLTPVEPADKRTLLRRAYFGLIGLPPTPEEVERFVEDDSPTAFTRVVDRLLASPHYGERFGRAWLDIARYGEDQAHSFQPRLYPQGFRYRDWLVHALNRDLPYDRFIMEQIAGDLLEDGDRRERLPALGFFALGPVYYGDRKMFDQLDDRVDTLTRGILGLTVACARCHDHKSDPISMKDYYALAGVFASSEYVEAPLAPQSVVDAYNNAQAVIQARSKEIDELLDRESTRLAEAQLPQTADYLLAVWNFENQRRSNPKTTIESVAKSASLEPQILERFINYLSRDETRKRPEFNRWLSAAAGLSSSNKDSTDSRPPEIKNAAQSLTAYITSLSQLRRALDEHNNLSMALASAQETIAPQKLDEARIALLDEFVGKNGLFAVARPQLEKRLTDDRKTELVRLRKELDELKAKAPPKYPFAHSLKEAGAPRNLQVLVRGNPDNPGDEVPRHFLGLLSGGKPPVFKQGSGRLELARAIADPANPLTARVMVNRIWQYHFGEGLVRTPSNFGLLGEKPTHPELLDYLADEFMASGWSIKSVHRLILLSATYQLSSRTERRNRERDPENQLWWRMNRRRLEIEAWRDGILAVSGNFNPTLGGPSFNLGTNENGRRTFYASISRHDLNSLLRLFDFPDPNVTSAQRAVTTVPLQQLFVLNSDFMATQAKALARALRVDPRERPTDRIQRAYHRVYGRSPTDAELRIGLEFVSKQAAGTDSPALDPWEQYAQVLLSANEFMYVD